jgi:phage terminase large subunit
LPLKDWAEHIGSAWRYLGLCWKEITPPKEKKAAPKQLEYTVQPDGTVQGNMSVKEAVDRMVKRRRMMDD